MDANLLLDEIREVNLSYLMLAQQLLHEDRDMAMYRLGLAADAADLIMDLTPMQVAKLSASNTLLSRFRCDDRSILEMLTGYGKQRALSRAHAALLMSGKPASAMA